MAWDSFSNYNDSPQSKQELHILNVYKDTDFLNEVEAIFPKDRTVPVSQFSLDPKTKLAMFKGKKQWKFTSHSAFIESLPLANQQQQSEAKELIKLIPKVQVAELSQRFQIREDDVWFYLLGNARFERVYRDTSPYTLLNSDIDDNHIVRIRHDITKEDFLNLWDYIKKAKLNKQGKLPKNRMPANPELIYAIFKQRQKSPPVSFGKITKMYLSGTLPNFSDKPKSTMTVQNLTREYNRYKPDNYL